MEGEKERRMTFCLLRMSMFLKVDQRLAESGLERLDGGEVEGDEVVEFPPPFELKVGDEVADKEVL